METIDWAGRRACQEILRWGGKRYGLPRAWWLNQLLIPILVTVFYCIALGHGGISPLLIVLTIGYGFFMTLIVQGFSEERMNQERTWNGFRFWRWISFFAVSMSLLGMLTVPAVETMLHLLSQICTLAIFWIACCDDPPTREKKRERARQEAS